jgi:hypothetical protein
MADPDAALHGAQPGKFAPAAAAPPQLAQDTGTLADAFEPLPRRRPVPVITQPIEQEKSWGEWLTSGWDQFGKAYDAGRELGRNDRSDFDFIAQRDGYSPILDALGLPSTDNPVAFGDPAVDIKAGGLMPSELLRRGGKDWMGAMTDRAGQEAAIVAEIRARRAKDPKFLAGVPDTVDGLHAYFLENEKKRRASANQNMESAGSGAGVTAGQLAGGMVESLHDPLNIVTLPIGGGGKTVLQVLARETLLNGAIEALQLPFVAHNRKEVGEHLTVGEAAADVATAGVAGGVLETAAHGVGKGAGKVFAAVRGKPDLAVSSAYKLFAALPERMQKKYGPGIVTNWGKRLAEGDGLDDVLAELSNDELAGMAKGLVGEDKLTPEEKAAAAHLDRSSEIAASSPYEADAKGAATHEEKLGEALQNVIADTPRPETKPLPSVGSDEAATASPARPPEATSTARRRPLAPALGPVKIPAWIYEGLKKRGIPDHIARGASAGSAAEALGGDARALNPTSGAFGIGQWLGSRKDELFRRYGASPSPEQQLDYLAWELKGGDKGGKSVLAATDEVDALNRYVRDFMRPAAGAETNGDLKRGLTALGRGGDDLPDVAASSSSSAELADDPEIARLREDALKLDDAVIGAPASAVPPMYARQFRPDDLTIDAARFQFKAGGDAAGVTDRLRGVDQWNPMYAGRVVAWEDAGGGVFLVDGHQRLGLAKRLEAEGHAPIGVDALVLREADGVSADDARVYGALKNIAEGTGSMVDAAKVIRGAGDHLLAHLPPRSALVRDARALAALSDEAFGAVYNDVLPPDFAAVIGHLLPDRPEAHGAMVDLLVKTDPANRGQAESIVRQGIAAGMHKAEQVELFGTREVMSSLMLERAKVLEKVLANLRKTKLVFKTAAKEADTLEAVGSKIAKSASEKEAQANAQALEIVSRLAFSHGPIADALNDAARKLAAGARLGDVADDAARAIRATDIGALAREAANDDASRLVPDGAGRGGDSGEAGEAVREEPNEEQPSLADLERATERFSDPDGRATKQQAESSFHDLKANVAADEAFQLERNTGFLVGLAAIADGGEQGQIGRYHWRKMHDPEGDWISVTVAGEPGDLGDDISHLLTKGHELVSTGKVAEDLKGELGRILESVKPAARRERIKAATKALEGGKPGELRTVEPFPEEPGYHRFRYVAEDGTAVGGNYTIDGNLIEGFNIGDTHNKAALGPKELRKLFAQLHAEHPEVRYVHGYRMSGARAKEGAGETEMWLELTDKGAKLHREDPRPAAEQVAEKPPLDLGEQKDPAIAARQRQELELRVKAMLRPGATDAKDTGGLALFDHANEPTFRMGEEGEEISADDLLKELEDDDKAIATLKGCL